MFTVYCLPAKSQSLVGGDILFCIWDVGKQTPGFVVVETFAEIA